MLCVGGHYATPEERVGIVRSESTLRYTYNLLYSLSGTVMTIMLRVDSDALQLDSARANERLNRDKRSGGFRAGPWAGQSGKSLRSRRPLRRPVICFV